MYKLRGIQSTPLFSNLFSYIYLIYHGSESGNGLSSKQTRSLTKHIFLSIQKKKNNGKEKQKKRKRNKNIDFIK